MSLNTLKFLSYAEGWRRINAANEKGFYFESVTLCESIISDRLLSYVRGVNPRSKSTTRTSFSALIREWRALARRNPLEPEVSDLIETVDKWREERNIIVHGLAKSAPGEATAQLKPFLLRAEQAAKTGGALARAVCKWHAKQRILSKAPKRRL